MEKEIKALRGNKLFFSLIHKMANKQVRQADNRCVALWTQGGITIQKGVTDQRTNGRRTKPFIEMRGRI